MIDGAMTFETPIDIVDAAKPLGTHLSRCLVVWLMDFHSNGWPLASAGILTPACRKQLTRPKIRAARQSVSRGDSNHTNVWGRHPDGRLP
jgi:hypothetical protein